MRRSAGVGHCNVQQECGRPKVDRNERQLNVNLPQGFAGLRNRFVLFFLDHCDSALTLKQVGEEVGQDIANSVVAFVN